MLLPYGEFSLITHERTKTSREVRALEKELATKLQRIAQKTRKDPLYPFNIDGLRRKYGPEVQATIQQAVQKTYIAGADYVAEYEEIPSILTQRDIFNIQEKTRFEAEGFWRAITRDAVNKQIPDFTRAVNISSATSLLATAATTGALALATIDKTRQLGDGESEAIWITAVDEKVCPICRPLHQKTWKLGDPNLLTPGQDTHPNCRCRVLLKDGREIFSH